ncbi:MAG: hypothetical protein VKL59_25455 [Nostocaceae cyanobacterium]|nr:hypothetical protein [Nostocaceae cyanobacterium]
MKLGSTHALADIVCDYVPSGQDVSGASLAEFNSWLAVSRL